ncbi:MAG: hypothetical protein P4L10_13505 [Acidobacteriaceae bacterium]|jgi:hypothetical protein|nr:hypothetical protein [Acidobacteriaceae bacterium]
MKSFAALALSFVSVCTLAQAQEQHPHELMGFLLGQQLGAVASEFGQPFREGEMDKLRTYHAYHVPGAPETYLVAITEKDTIKKLELTGTDYHGETSFLGLHLGDSTAAIEKLVGKPSAIRHEDDVNVDLWDYMPSTFSLEVSPDKKLYSIQVVDAKIEPKDLTGADLLLSFAKAVAAGDVDRIMVMSSGDLRCGDPDSMWNFGTERARHMLGNAQSGMRQCLQYAASIVQNLGLVLKGAEINIRVYDNDKSWPGCVIKFPESSPLKEVAFHWEANEWRIYDVVLRPKKDEKEVHQEKRTV